MSDATEDGRQVERAAIEDYLAELRTFPPPESFARSAIVSDRSMFEKAANDPEGFWPSRPAPCPGSSLGNASSTGSCPSRSGSSAAA